MDEIPHYLSICSIYRDDAGYLREWIEFHRLVGAGHFFLYDNLSSDDHREVLAPYMGAGIVTLHDWPIPATAPEAHPPSAVKAFTDCLHRHRNDSRWIAFLDIDEFLFSPTGTPVSELLVRYESAPAVVVSRYEYGPSGHVRKPDGLVTESYLDRAVEAPDARVLFKSIVDPARTRYCLGYHRFLYTEGGAVNESGVAIGEGAQPRRAPLSASRLRINHYGTKSEEELRKKDELWSAAGRDRSRVRVPWSNRQQVTDDVITRFAPALHEAMGGAESTEGRRRPAP